MRHFELDYQPQRLDVCLNSTITLAFLNPRFEHQLFPEEQSCLRSPDPVCQDWQLQIASPSLILLFPLGVSSQLQYSHIAYSLPLVSHQIQWILCGIWTQCDTLHAPVTMTY
ncbi:hypothetical protein VN97_g294 [Penicillium thymicola]|uniref:Uncharacterized protein n=1 Tax=Penicillium thymicola TaxID=293382 RepID=A0AAI9TT64_PENTH|nr:hypothetical protein VN97_g294 [Penicillium thymicola]